MAYHQPVDNYLDEKLSADLIINTRLVITLEKNILGMRHLDIGVQRLTSMVLIQIKSMKLQK